MNTLNAIRLTAALLGIAIAGTAGAQQAQPEQFPTERTKPASCDDVNWNAELQRYHPELIGACQEVVIVDGQSWARFAARFVRVESDDTVIFNVRDARDRSIEDVTLVPAAGQVAYIDDRATPFEKLRTTDTVSLYVPEGEYGFATQPGAPKALLARIAPPAKAPYIPAPLPVRQTVAQRAPLPATLPQTASPLPWVALAGLLALLAGLGLTLQRRF